ncbi:TlpA disulfide reductase family protein [Pedobacter sp. PLR]|uniref:TlpA family protein disulfide reductase n=1 Tax=Pedobacter sp. PLR TaxID=2994465 RepID=UPI002245A4B3|nr:TlpA disulfide reductase family protein [Pedobacter sp. PLR]MCX2450055.1 TlpA disulfide reductase family protein [Pedobacter sp. PLR]
MMAIKFISRTMILEKIFLLAAICSLSFSIRAQSHPEVQLNDTLPDIPIQFLIQPEQSPLTTSMLIKKGGLIINFWATWCKPCVKELEFLATQANKHKDSLSILSISYEDKTTVQKFLDNHKNIARSSLKIVTDDKLFSQLFFHQALPHNVWINRQGVVKAITGGESITEANLIYFLNDKIKVMDFKKEIPFDQLKPLQVPDSLLGFRSIFVKKLEGVEMSGTVISPGKLGRPNMKRYFEFNSLIKDMIYNAYQMPGLISNDYLMEIITNDSSKYFWPGEKKNIQTYKGESLASWQKNNQYTYELRTANRLTDSIFSKHVISDLELNLGIHTRKVLKKRNCWVVTYDVKSNKIKKADKDSPYRMGIIDNKLLISNVPLDYLLNWIVSATFRTPRKEPYLNKTKINYSITAEVDLGDDPSLYPQQQHIESCLSKQLGLKFKLKNAKYPIIQIIDL